MRFSLAILLAVFLQVLVCGKIASASPLFASDFQVHIVVDENLTASVTIGFYLNDVSKGFSVNVPTGNWSGGSPTIAQNLILFDQHGASRKPRINFERRPNLISFDRSDFPDGPGPYFVGLRYQYYPALLQFADAAALRFEMELEFPTQITAFDFQYPPSAVPKGVKAKVPNFSEFKETRSPGMLAVVYRPPVPAGKPFGVAEFFENSRAPWGPEKFAYFNNADISMKMAGIYREYLTAQSCADHNVAFTPAQIDNLWGAVMETVDKSGLKKRDRDHVQKFVRDGLIRTAGSLTVDQCEILRAALVATFPAVFPESNTTPKIR